MKTYVTGPQPGRNKEVYARGTKTTYPSTILVLPNQYKSDAIELNSCIHPYAVDKITMPTVLVLVAGVIVRAMIRLANHAKVDARLSGAQTIKHYWSNFNLVCH